MSGELRRHPLAVPWPEPDEAEWAEIAAEVCCAGRVSVFLLDGQVLTDWWEYGVAVERGLPHRFLDWGGEGAAAARRAGVVLFDDPAGHVISVNRDRGLTRREMARGVVAVRPWRGAGRLPAGTPAGPTARPRTTREMAAEAGCAPRTITEAKAWFRTHVAASLAQGERERATAVVSAASLAAQRARIAELRAALAAAEAERDALRARLVRYERVPRQ